MNADGGEGSYACWDTTITLIVGSSTEEYVDIVGVVNRPVKGVKSWPEDTQSREVVCWASKEFPTLLLCVVEADKQRDAVRFQELCKQIREVATRIDGFRRMKQRQWREQEKRKHADQSTD